MDECSIKGLDSYRIEDGSYFFGRDGDSERLTSRILSSRFTLLHALSGAGKTSLLQAKVTRDLEAQGWTVAMTRPGRHAVGRSPALTVQEAVLKTLTPPPNAELASIDRAFRALAAIDCPGFQDPGVLTAEGLVDCCGDLTVNQLIAKYRSVLKLAEDSKAGPDVRAAREITRKLQSPAEPSATYPLRDAYYAVFNSVLRGGMPPAAYLSHVAAFCAHTPVLDTPALAAGVPVKFIVGILDEARKGLYEALYAVLDARFDTLTEFFTRLFAVYGKWRPNLKLAVVLDQFEELFTLYGDPSTAPPAELALAGLEDVHSYKLRNEFFEQLEEVYHRMREGTVLADASAGPALPVCCVVSIRQEFIAELDPLRAFVNDLDYRSFHLDRLNAATATQVLVKITKETGWGFGEKLAGRIANGLRREGRYVDPAELQVVTSRILDQIGQDPGPESAFERLGATGADSPDIDDAERTRNILNSFFTDFLDRASKDLKGEKEAGAARIELLEVLQALITERGKSPAPLYKLLEVPFRSRRRREELLDTLEKKLIVRREMQHNIMMVEIRHDFLIKPIQRAVREGLKSEEYGRLIAAQAILSARIEALSYDPTRSLLTFREYEDLSDQKEKLNWNYMAAGWRLSPKMLMLRSAMSFDTLPKNMDKWAEPSNAMDDGDPAIIRVARDSVLSREELAILNRDRDRYRLNPDEILAVIRNHVELCRDHERSSLEYWTRQWEQEVNGRRDA